ncbi:class I SAM-dependent methyltransferase [Azospirillum sp.]|uniref:class I SAM-dependent methyltransferase n=1 Tax=Azospirillum sp. TaxID=34012 RepID=UPI002D4299AC|nr:class I SAM-dependent methyltransferase [Azospirillum sp.]HYD64550.1 class I SAM-dependent methyltransferase [Azospirillum sp.]
MELKKIKYHPTVSLVRDEYFKRFPDKAERFGENDWKRVCHVFGRLCRGDSLLEVGVGQGPFINCVSQSRTFDRLIGIDIKSYSMFFKIRDNYDVLTMNAAAMAFPDRSFDVVTCMEVLEHLEPDVFERALAELRRVCRHQLLITVPFKEPLPLPKYHKLRFDEADLLRCFPTGRFTLLRKDNPRKVPWVLVEERVDRPEGADKPWGWFTRIGDIIGRAF